ncbi:polysaccharide pyruvyl transferase family protein, partial [Planctomycetota bacterium]
SFIETRSDKTISTYGIISRILFFRKIPYCIIGTGLGPVTTPFGRWGVSSTLKSAKCISLRDPESVEYAKEISIDLNIKTYVDMVLSDLVSINENYCERFGKVAVHFGPMIERHINIDTLIKLIKKIRLLNIYVGLVSDCKPPEGDGISVFDKLARALGEEVEYIPYKGVDDFSRTLDRFDVILTSKLHGGILGYTKGLFPISIAEHVKTKRFYKQIGLEKYCFELSEEGFEKAINSLDEIRKNPKLAMELLDANRDTVRSLACKNKDVLSEFLTSVFL